MVVMGGHWFELDRKSGEDGSPRPKGRELQTRTLRGGERQCVKSALTTKSGSRREQDTWIFIQIAVESL